MKQLETDVGIVSVTDINDWFLSLNNLNRECNCYTDSELRYKEIIEEHDNQIRADAIDKCLNKVLEIYNTYPFELGFVITALEQLKEQKE